AQLILQAATLGQGGEIFVLEMGQPIRILDLARHMISLAGFTPEEDIPIVFTGLRPGEKLHEELVAEEEEIASTAHDRIRVLRSSGPDPALASWLGRLEGALAAAGVPRALALLQEMGPTYHPSAHAAADAEHPARPSAAQKGGLHAHHVARPRRSPDRHSPRTRAGRSLALARRGVSGIVVPVPGERALPAAGARPADRGRRHPRASRSSRPVVFGPAAVRRPDPDSPLPLAGPASQARRRRPAPGDRAGGLAAVRSGAG